MQRDILKYLLDIQVSINSIHDYLGVKRDFNEYKSNKLLRRGIERDIPKLKDQVDKLIDK
jgi:uncharacterized protein with HEPN domain